MLHRWMQHSCGQVTGEASDLATRIRVIVSAERLAAPHDGSSSSEFAHRANQIQTRRSGNELQLVEGRRRGVVDQASGRDG